MDLIEIDNKEIVNKVRDITANKRRWHFHFLTPNCVFNDKEKFALILEDEDKKEHCVCYFDEKPEELKIFENLFFNRPEKFNKY